MSDTGTWEDNWIGRTASITGVQSCWMGFIRDHVANNAICSDNIVGGKAIGQCVNIS